MSTQDTTLPPLEQERATFEAWKRTQTDGWTDFEVWQARAALAAQAPQPEPCGFMSRATYSTSSGAGYKQITFRFSELIAANQIRLWAMSYGAKAANHEVPKWAPQQAQGVAADADLASVAYQGYDSYWTENCLGDESEAWASSAKAVLAFCAAAPKAAPAPEFLPTKEHIRELANEAADQVMEQAQVFASAWSLVGGRFDSGNAIEDAEEAKTELRTMVRSLADLAAESVRPAPAPAPQALTDAARDVLVERQRQISAEGWTPEHDDEHRNGELAYAAGGYAVEAADRTSGLQTVDPVYSPIFPDGWDFKLSKPRRMLVKAGALILAEIERLDRAARAASAGGEG